ncbi:MAG: hypothetical protein AB7F59_10685 [Bdellovibrionales bacterium]
MEIKSIESVEASKSVFPIMNELRSHLDESKYLDLLQAARANGYELFGAFDLPPKKWTRDSCCFC